MAVRSLIELRGFFEDIPGGSKSISPSDLQNNDPPSVELLVTLTTGENTIDIPANAYGAIIIFDPASVVAKTLLGASGDTGIILDPASWSVITFPVTPPTNFLIDSAAVEEANIIYF